MTSVKTVATARSAFLLWLRLIIAGLTNCLTLVNSIDGVHHSARNALLYIKRDEVAKMKWK
ncbi:hypothetical protein AEM38_11520 [Hyphomonadaceae bacterium UKL13-1]|nr:hypothetical protein AEM38_11520 [Hyphomonadaceae bacterium UKL13-1]